MAPIRVLFVVPDLRFGGAERHAVTLLAKLNRAKFSPSAICIGEEGALYAELVASGVEARALHLGGQRNALLALRRLISHMRSARPDVVVVRGYNAEMLGRIAALVTGVKCSVVWVHDMGDIERRSVVRQWVGRALMPTTSRHFGVAEAQRQYLLEGLRCPAEKICIIHNGVDPASFDGEGDRSSLAEFGVYPEDCVIGIVAALRPEKDHATLLRATCILLRDVPTTKLLVIGDGPDRDNLVRLCDELGISERVRFVGDRNDVPRILRSIDVVVLCSVTECLPISVLEAMACSRPVVCSAVGGVGELVEHGVSGYLVQPGDPQALSDRLRAVLSDRSLARRMGRAGRARVESEFTLKQSVLAAEKAIEEAVGRCRQ